MKNKWKQIPGISARGVHAIILESDVQVQLCHSSKLKDNCDGYYL